MTLDEAGRLSQLWKDKNGDKYCSHDRIVDSLINEKGKQVKGSLVCKECGTIFFEIQREKLREID